MTRSEHAAVTVDHILTAIAQIGLGSIRHDVKRLEELLNTAIVQAESDTECKVYLALIDYIHLIETEIAYETLPRHKRLVKIT